MHITNTELGIIYPPMPGSKKIKEQIIKNLPYTFPPKDYLEGDRPWISDKDFPL